MIRKTILGIAVAALTSVASVASAATFSGTFGGDFTSSQGYGGPGSLSLIPGSGGAGVQWGAPNKSTLEILEGPYSHEIQAGTNSYELGRIEWFNETWVNFDPFFRLFATLSLDIDSPVSTSDTDNIRFDIDTSNNANNPNADEAFLVGFQDFFIPPLDLGNGATLTDIVLSLAGDGSLTGNNWVNPEQGTSQLVFSAVINAPAPVPLPAAGFLLIAGLGGLGVMRRMRKT